MQEQPRAEHERVHLIETEPPETVPHRPLDEAPDEGGAEQDRQRDRQEREVVRPGVVLGDRSRRGGARSAPLRDGRLLTRRDGHEFEAEIARRDALTRLARREQRHEGRQAEHQSAGDREIERREQRLRKRDRAALWHRREHARGNDLRRTLGGGHRKRCRSREAAVPDEHRQIAARREQRVVAGEPAIDEASRGLSRHERTDHEAQAPVQEPRDDRDRRDEPRGLRHGTRKRRHSRDAPRDDRALRDRRARHEDQAHLHRKGKQAPDALRPPRRKQLRARRRTAVGTRRSEAHREPCRRDREQDREQERIGHAPPDGAAQEETESGDHAGQPTARSRDRPSKAARDPARIRFE